jgi:hypothetical protein
VTETWDTSRWPFGVRQGLDLLLAGKTRKGIEQTLVKLKAVAELDTQTTR